MREVSDEKLDRYFDVTSRALDKVKADKNNRSSDFTSVAADFLDMAERYFKDAKYFRDKGDYVNALAALAYAHAWLDAGARIGIFKVDHDNKLFTVD